MFVQPREGFKIRDPFKKDHLPPEGREVSDGDLYWHRLLRDGDVIVVSPTAEPATVPAQSPTRITQPTQDRSID